MTKQTMQKLVINVVGGVLAGLFSFYFLKQIPFYPEESRTWLALGSGGLWAINPILGVVASMGLYIIPITYTSLTVSIIFLLFLLIVAVFDTWSVGPFGFLVLAAMLVILLHPELNFLILSIPILAGFLGPRRGAILGGFSCFIALALGVIMGKPAFGPLVVEGAERPILHLKGAPVGEIFGSGWLAAQTNAGLIDTPTFNAVLSPFGDHFAMLAQIIFWALAAGITGYLLTRLPFKKIASYVIAVPSGMIILVAGILVMPILLTTSTGFTGNLWLTVLVPAAFLLAMSPGLKFIVPIMTPKRQNQDDKEAERTENLIGTCGLDLPQKEIKKIIDRQFGRSGTKNTQPARGIFLFGPPGNNNTRLARSIAEEAKATLIVVGKDDLTPKYYDVFVSYSTLDKAVADACVAMLEANTIRCWYAPRDIEPGADWGKEVTTAIGLSKMVLLIFSGNSNHSQRVQDEINFAITQELPILPFRIENVKPSDALMLHLSSRHWLDAYAPSWQEYQNDLRRLVSSTLEAPGVKKEKAHKKKTDLRAQLQHVFIEAQEKRPSILFFEELLEYAPGPDKDTVETIGITDTFLECLDQLANTSGVLVLGTTETPEAIDGAVFEAGRLDKMFYLPPPDRLICRDYLKKYLMDKPLALNVDFNKLASMLDGYSLSDIETVCAEAADLAESTRGAKQKPVGMTDLEKVVKSRKPAYSMELLLKYEVFAAEHGCNQKKSQTSGMILQKAN